MQAAKIRRLEGKQETVYAEDKRLDISVSFAGLNVPVEIRRSCHRDAWSSVRSQLIVKYTQNPRAAGYGISLVSWFGDSEKCLLEKCVTWTPKMAEDVRLRIEQSLDSRERRLTSVYVMNVSRPH